MQDSWRRSKNGLCPIAKTFAELTSRQDGVIRQQLIEQLMREIMNYDAELGRDDATGVSGSHRKKRGEHLVTIRISDAEIEHLKARGYAAEIGFALATVVEASASDSLAESSAERAAG